MRPEQQHKDQDFVPNRHKQVPNQADGNKLVPAGTGLQKNTGIGRMVFLAGQDLAPLRDTPRHKPKEQGVRVLA